MVLFHVSVPIASTVDCQSVHQVLMIIIIIVVEYYVGLLVHLIIWVKRESVILGTHHVLLLPPTAI